MQVYITRGCLHSAFLEMQFPPTLESASSPDVTARQRQDGRNSAKWKRLDLLSVKHLLSESVARTKVHCPSNQRLLISFYAQIGTA